MDLEQQWEQRHFSECRELIAKNIVYYEEKAREGKAETEALFAAVASGDVELYNQLIVSKDIQEHNERQLRKNRAAYEKPYFGRIDYQERESGQKEQLYIGKNGVSRDKTHVVIVDWRAPVSTLYYENELGPGSYEVPEIGEIAVELKLKRTFDVSGGQLLGYYDNDTAATDELLVKYLSQNKDVILGDIISTIQKEQNEIIRQTPFRSLIVQGVAGSGKTTVAMHRISYILYNYEERFRPDEFCIIGSSDMLLHYITSGLPELDVYHVGQLRMDAFFRELLGKEWKKSYRLRPLSEGESFKSRLEFAEALDAYLLRLRQQLFSKVQVEDGALGVILSRESIQRTLLENPRDSIARLYKLLNERIRSRIRFLVPEDNKDFCREKQKEYRGYFCQGPELKNLVGLYRGFLMEYGEEQGILVESVLTHISRGQFDIYDLAALALIQKRMTEKEFHEEYGQIIIDEAQDFGAAVYYVMKQVLHGCYFTIMGDVSQNIHFETGMNDWEALTEGVFAGERTGFHVLAKSYRNTIEISEVAGRVLERASFGKYKIQPVIRHGVPVEFYRVSPREMAEKTAALIGEIKGRRYETIAVICRDQAEAEAARGELAARGVFQEESEAASEKGTDGTLSGEGTDGTPSGEGSDGTLFGEAEESGGTLDFRQGVMVLPIYLTKGLEFDCVILWNPDRKAYAESQGDAKLLYVAITRALHELHVVYHGELTELLGEAEQAS